MEIISRDPESKSRARWIMVRGEHSRWRAPNGITLGTGLRTLERMNGRPPQRRQAWGSPEQVAQVTNYSSGHPAMQALNPRVVALVLEYPRP